MISLLTGLRSHLLADPTINGLVHGDTGIVIVDGNITTKFPFIAIWADTAASEKYFNNSDFETLRVNIAIMDDGNSPKAASNLSDIESAVYSYIRSNLDITVSGFASVECYQLSPGTLTLGQLDEQMVLGIRPQYMIAADHN
jgi:hypothetical protein